MTKTKNNNDVECFVLDVTSIWSKISSYAIQEDVTKYLGILDETLKSLNQETIVYMTGRSPVWIYIIFTSWIVTHRPDIYLFYSKPTVHGNRNYKINPLISTPPKPDTKS